MLNEERKEFAEWLVIPKREKLRIREEDPDFPITDKEYAGKIGRSQKTLCEWKKDREFIRYREKIRKSKIREKYDDMLYAIGERALEGDYNAFKEITTFTGDRVEKSQVGLSFDDVDYLLQELIKVIHSEVKDAKTINRISDKISDLMEKLDEE